MGRAVRLNKYLSMCGVASRRSADELIVQGRVTVNSRVATLGQKVDPERDEVRVDGRLVKPDRKLYIMYYKPRGVISSLGEERDNLRELIDEIGVRLYPAGRLDVDAEGLMILTNDGELANRIAHPRYSLPKEYLVYVDKEVSEKEIADLVAGVDVNVEGKGLKKVVPDRVELVAPKRFKLVIHVGYKHVVKKMMESLSLKVVRLIRIAVGPVTLGNLKPGEYRPIPRRKLNELRRMLRL